MISNTLSSDSVAGGNEPSEYPLDLSIQKNRVVAHSEPEKRSHPTEVVRQKQPEENIKVTTVGQVVDMIVEKLVVSSYTKDLPSQNEQAVSHLPDLLPEDINAFLVQQSGIPIRTQLERDIQSLISSKTMPLENFGSQIQSSNKESDPNTVPDGTNQSVSSPATMPVDPTLETKSDSPVNMPLKDLETLTRSTFEVNKHHWSYYPNNADTSLCIKRSAETVVSDPRGNSVGSFDNSFTTPRIHSCPGYLPAYHTHLPTPTSTYQPTSPSLYSSFEENRRNIESGKQESTASVRKELRVAPPEVNTQTQMDMKAYSSLCLKRPAKTFVSDPRGNSVGSFDNSFSTPRIHSCPGYTPTSPSLCSSIEENRRNIESGKQESTASVPKKLRVAPPDNTDDNPQTQMDKKAYTHKKFRAAVLDK